MSILKIPTAKIFEPLLQPARYKGAFGGRGSGKSHFFGELMVETCQAERGTLAVCIREAQRTLAQSSKRLIESKIASLGVGSEFRVYSDKIETPGDGIIIFRGMQAFCLNSLTVAWGYCLALTGLVLQFVDAAGDALDDQAIKDQVSAAIGDPTWAGRVLLAISIVTVAARLRSIRKPFRCG